VRRRTAAASSAIAFVPSWTVAFGEPTRRRLRPVTRYSRTIAPAAKAGAVKRTRRPLRLAWARLTWRRPGRIVATGPGPGPDAGVGPEVDPGVVPSVSS